MANLEVKSNRSVVPSNVVSSAMEVDDITGLDSDVAPETFEILVFAHDDLAKQNPVKRFTLPRNYVVCDPDLIAPKNPDYKPLVGVIQASYELDKDAKELEVVLSPPEMDIPIVTAKAMDRIVEYLNIRKGALAKKFKPPKILDEDDGAKDGDKKEEDKKATDPNAPAEPINFDEADEFDRVKTEFDYPHCPSYDSDPYECNPARNIVDWLEQVWKEYNDQKCFEEFFYLQSAANWLGMDHLMCCLASFMCCKTFGKTPEEMEKILLENTKKADLIGSDKLKEKLPEEVEKYFEQYPFGRFD